MSENCKECIFVFDAPDGLHCRRYPPTGQLVITPGKLVGSEPAKSSVSFHPNVNEGMSCGEFRAAG